MLLTRLLYFSERRHDKRFDPEQMLQSAADNNKTKQITGALWYTGEYFIQVLEGGRHAVSETYHKIAADDRHYNIELVSCGTVHERLFPQWSMGYFGETIKNRETVLRFATTDQLNPREMTPESMIGLLMLLELR